MKLFLILLLLISVSGLGQKRVSVPEVGILAGGSYYLGDLNPSRHFDETKFAAGIFYRNTVNKSDRVSWRLHFNYASVAADDADSRNEALRSRNLNFKSKIFEFGGAFEFHFLQYEIGSDRRPGTPYIFVGLNFFKMNPQGNFEGDWIELQSLGTEGQGTSLSDRKRYRSIQVSLPVGVGMKVNLNSRFALGVEYGVRKTYTDYLDDVSGKYVDSGLLESQNGELAASIADPSLDDSFGRENQNRGNAVNKDWYSIFGVTLSYRIRKYSTCPPKRR